MVIENYGPVCGSIYNSIGGENEIKSKILQNLLSFFDQSQ